MTINRQIFWVFLTIALDIYPFIFLHFLAIKSKLRIGYAKAIFISSVILLFQFCGFVWFSESVKYDPVFMMLYRLSSFVVMISLTLIFVRKNYSKSAFVFSLIFPYDAFILVVGVYLSGFFAPTNAPPFMFSAITRLCLSVVTFPFMFIFLKKQLIPMMDVHDDEVFKYAWPIPASLTLLSVLFISPYYEQTGASVLDALARVAILFSTLAVCILLFKVLKKTKKKAETVARSQLLLALQAEQYEELANNIEKTKVARHDLRHQLSVIGNLAHNKEYDKLNGYIDDLVGNMVLVPTLFVCENFAVNAIAAHYIALAKEQSIDVLVDFAIDDNVRVENTDLCIIIGNCMENAVEACGCVPTENRFIKTCAKQFNNTLSITFDNRFDGEIKQDKNMFFSRKRGFAVEGMGISSVKAVVQKYGGQIDIEIKGTIFSVSILLQNNEKATSE